MKTAGGALDIISARYAPRTEWIRLAIVMLIFCLLSFCTGVFVLYFAFQGFFSLLPVSIVPGDRRSSDIVSPRRLN